MDELYIPPCCIDRKLPPIVRAGGPCSFFYSQGDWGVAKLWGALASLVSGTDGNTLCVLVIDDVDEFLLRIIANYMDRRWIRAMVLITSTDRTSMVKDGLSGCLDSIFYCGNRDEAKHSNLWIRSNGKLSLAVVGPLDKGSGNSVPIRLPFRRTSIVWWLCSAHGVPSSVSMLPSRVRILCSIYF